MVMIWEGIFLALRFLNFPVINKYIGLVLIAVSMHVRSVFIKFIASHPIPPSNHMECD